MSKRVILVGPGAAGKDTLKERFISRGYKPSISYTTRPKRSNEKDGENYHFVDLETFKKMIDNGEFYEWQVYGVEEGLNWHYGTTKNDFYAADIFIMTPDGLSDVIKQGDRDSSMIIYLCPDQKIRKERLSKRNDADTVEGRLLRDKIDFKDFTNYDVLIENEEF